MMRFIEEKKEIFWSDFIVEGYGVDLQAVDPRAPRPPWLDEEKCRRGQRFALDHVASISFAEIISLSLIFSFERALDALVFTRKSSTPFCAFQRYVSTARRLETWYAGGDPWDPSSQAGRSIRAVRAMHLSVEKQIEKEAGNQKLFKIEHPCCPHLNTIKSDFRAHLHVINNIEVNANANPFCQTLMMATQFAFVGLAVLYPEKFGIHCKNEDLEAFLHMWAVLGHLLGTQDRFNFCLGSLKECRDRTEDLIQNRIKTDLREVGPDWEHMSRSLLQGMHFAAPELNFEAALCYVCWVIGVPMPSYFRSLPWHTKLRFYFYRLMFNVLFYLPGFRTFMNIMFRNRLRKSSELSEDRAQELKLKSQQYLKKNKICEEK